MLEWLDNNDTFMYLTHNEAKSVTADRFIKTLKAKIYKKFTTNNSKSYLSYLNKLVDQYKASQQILVFRTSHSNILKRPLKILFDYPWDVPN